MADMDLSTQLDALDEVNQNVTDRPKGFTGESGLLGDIYADGIADKFKTHLRNKRDVDNMDSMIASEAESHRFDASEWEKEVKYRQDLLDDPSISGQDVDLLKKNLDYAQKRHKEASELYAKTNSLRARNLDDLPGTALERGLFRGLGEIVRTGAATAQNITESLGYEETAKGIGTVRDIIGPDDESKAFQMRPMEWAEAKGVGGIASYVGEKAGGVLPWLAAGYAAPYTTFGYGMVSGQGDMRRLLEEQGVTDKATLRKTSYIYGTLMGGLMNVVPWVTMKGLTPNAMRAFQGTVTKIATRMATHTATTTSAQVAASALASWAETFGVNYATGKPVNWEEAVKKSIETGGENIVPGLLFGMFGEGHKALSGGYKIAKGGTLEQPQTGPTEPAKAQPTPEDVKAAEERKLAKLATEQTPEATTERQTIRTKQQDAERQALIDQHNAVSKELESLDKEMAAIESNPELSEVERAALTAEANLKRSPLIERSDALVAEMEKFTVQEPEVYQAPPEPDVPEGHTRFYHGGFPGAAKGDVWFTTSRQDADGWASRGPEMRVQYVDVRNGDPRVDWGDLPNGIAMESRQMLPPELATQRKVIETPTAEPQAPKVTDQERADFTAVLRTDATRDTWAEKLGVTPEKLADLVKDAERRGLVRFDRHGVARRTGKLYFSEPEKPIQMPDGEVTVRTELAQEKWSEMQSAVDDAVNELTDSKVKAVVREKIDALRSTSDQKYAIAKGQSGGSLSERVFGPQSSVSEAGGGNRGAAAREPGNKAASTTPKAGGGAEGAGAADARILRSEAATVRENGTPIVGRRIRGKAGYREGNNIQGVGTTRKLGLLPDHETLVTAEKLNRGDDKDVVAKLTYRVFDKGTAPDKASPRDSAHKALIELKQHDDGAWEVAYVEVAPRARGEGLATKLYAKVAKDVGIKQMSPSGQLTNDGYAYWSKRSPESVRWHQPSPTEEGMYYSPRHIKDEIARLEGYVKEVDKRTYLSDDDKAEFVSSYRQEISDLQRMWESLPDEAKTQQVTDSMFALRGFYSPAIRASVMEGQPLSARGGDEASILGKADPDNLIAYLAAKAIENEAARTGRTPIAEAIRTARHEVMEIAKAIGLISENEWSRLTKDAKAKGWVESQGVRDAYEGMYKEGMGPDQLEQLLLKEAIFEKFADFESKGKPPRNYAERVYQRIVDFFKSTMRGMREKLGIESSDDIFHKFDTGEMKKRFAEAGIERPKATEDGLYAARKAPPQPTPIEVAMASLRSELGMQMPKPWKNGKVAGIRQQAVSIAQLGGEQIMRLYGKQIAPALSKHEDAISGLSLPGSPEPFADGFKRAFNDYILRPDRFSHDNPELFNALRDALDAHTPHLLESIDAMHDMARERVTKLQKEELFIPVEEDKSTAAFVKKIAATPIKELISKPFHIAWDAYRKTLQPELFGSKALETDAAISRMNSASQQGKDALYLAEEKKLTWWKKQPMERRMQYLYDVEIGANQRSPSLAKMMKQDNERLLKSYNLEQRFGSKANYVEDYFPHLFKKPEQAVKWLSDNASKLGPDWFQRHRHYDLINDALKAGLELRSTNPAELILWRLMAGVDMRMRVQMLQDAKDIGTAVRLADLGKAEALQLENTGWQKVKAPNMDEWAISPEIQPLWKNSIDARSLWQAEGISGNIYRTWMSYKNTVVPIKLSLSLFHPTHVWSINFADKLAFAYSQMTRTGDFIGAMKTLSTSWWAGQGEGFDARMAWEKPKEERSKYENYLVWLMTEGGLVPTMPEEMKAVFARGMKEAYAEGRYLKVLPEAMRKAVQSMQTPFFERWIPGLKAQSYVAQVRLLLDTKPYLLDDPIKRRVAFRSIAKSVDNRFGEMFYKNMFWNRFVKDAGVASFLSLGWQTGFVREFGGAAAKVAIYPFAKAYLPKDNPYLLAMESNNKIAFVLSYVSTSLMMAGGITWMCTGEDPKEWDYVFPRIGGTNPDGTPRRVTTPFFTREAPMAMKHIQERGGNVPAGLADMMWNKMMYQPFVEFYRNRDYWGYEITDENAPWYKRWSQHVEHAFKENLSPITVSGAMKAKELSGLYDENIFEAATKDKSIGLSVLGFSPAPAYAERTPLENRIRHLYAEHKAPLKKPYEAQELDEIKRLAKQKLRRAIQEGDDVAAAEAKKEAIDAGSSRQSLTKKKLNTPSSTFLFSQLPVEDQRMLLKEASPEERNFFRKYARRNVRAEFPVEPVQ